MKSILANSVERVPHFLVPGTAVFIYLIFGTRWISYVVVGSVYVTDLLIAGAILSLAIQIAGNRQALRRQADYLLLIPVAFLLLWATVRFATEFNLDNSSIRDFAPYAYSALAIVGFFGILVSSRGQIKRTLIAVYFALLAHLIWIVLESIFPKLFSEFPFVNSSMGIRVLSTRGDVDVTYVAIFMCINLLLITTVRMSNLKIITLSFFAIISFAVLLASSTRSGVIAFVIAFLWLVLALVLKGYQPKRHLSKPMLVLPIGLLLVTILLGAKSPVLERASIVESTTLVAITPSNLSSESPVAPQETLAASGEGTVLARFNSWRSLGKWIFADAERAFVGAGFNENIMSSSGAGAQLVGPYSPELASLRAPHNFLVGTTAHLGLVGLGIYLSSFITFVVLVLRRVRSTSNFTPMLTMSFFPIALLLPATVGVILESPFGAIPYWWAIGVATALGCTTRIFKIFPSVTEESNCNA